MTPAFVAVNDTLMVIRKDGRKGQFQEILGSWKMFNVTRKNKIISGTLWDIINHYKIHLILKYYYSHIIPKLILMEFILKTSRMILLTC